jgi:transcriptional regulator with XRE-family HTH domain
MSTKKRDLNPRAVARGQAILKAREAHNLSQQDVANAIGNVTRVSVSHWEQGLVDEIERPSRLGLCKLFGFEERELLLEEHGSEMEFDVPVSREAKSIAYRWDELPEPVRVFLKNTIAEYQQLKNQSQMKQIVPEKDEKPKKRKR